MEKRYTVAGHTFALKMSDTTQAWNHIENYAPFETQFDEDSPAPVFTLETVRELPELETTLEYKDDADPDETRIELFRAADGRHVAGMAPSGRHPICAHLLMDSDFRHGMLKIDSYGKFSLDNSMMLMFAFSTASLMTLEMHASVIVNGGRGYLFLGKSGTGKSTHSRLWLENVPGSMLLNDDNPVVRLCDDGVLRVFGSPWSGKTPCYINDSAPIGSFVRIRQCPENRINKMSVVESYASIYSSSSGFKADKRMADGLHETIAAVATGTPCYLLDCLPDADAALLSSSTITKHKENED